jgi:photosystem II stability/assembly factor-like uncharacterized protein
MMKLAHALTWTVALLGTYTAAQGARWTAASTGLQDAVPGIRALIIDRATGSTLYALTSDDGIFKSSDGGASWNALGNITGVSALALDPTSASTIYAGTTHGVVTSTDEGISWSSAGLSDTSFSNLAVDPITPSTLYAGGNGHLYKSTDRGGSWTQLNLGVPSGGGGEPVYVAALVVDPLTPSSLYAAVGGGSAGNQLFKSLDGGQSWNVINSGPFYGSLLVIDPSTPSTLYAIRFGTGLSKSTDGGASWTATGFKDAVIALAVDPGNSNTLYLSTIGPLSTRQAIFKSTDGAQSWSAVDEIIPLAGSFVFSPDSSTIYAATQSGGVFKSTDAGTNWGETNTGLRILNIQMLVGDPVNTATIYAGGAEGLFKSVDGGGSWKKQAAFLLFCCALPPGLPPPALLAPFPPVAPASVHSLLIDFTNPSNLYLGTVRTNGCSFADILMYKSTDGGATWSNSINRDNSGCNTNLSVMVMDPTNTNTIYLGDGDDYDGYGLLKSTDGGAHWNATGLSANAESALVIDPITPANLYAGTDTGVLRSIDAGATWSPTGLANANVSLLAIDATHPNALYAGVTGLYPDTPGFKGLFKSTDSGASWSPINTGLDDVINTHAAVNALILDPVHTNVLYLGISGYGVFKSSDGGVTWNPFNDGLTFLDVRVLAIVRGVSPTVYGGTPGGVFKILDQGN